MRAARSVVGLLVTVLAVTASGAGGGVATAAGADPVTADTEGDQRVRNTSRPSIDGTLRVGQKLVADPGEWEPSGVRLHYRWWTDDGRLIGKHRGVWLRAGTLGERVRLVVTHITDSGEHVKAYSGWSDDIVRRGTFRLRERARLTGSSRFRHTLRVDPARWSTPPTRSRVRWYRNGQRIPGASGRRYRVRAADVGKRIRASVAVWRPGFHGTRTLTDVRHGRHRVGVRRSVTYSVETRGRIHANMRVFRRQAQQTFDDPRGWRGAGVKFRRVRDGGDFTLVLSHPSWVPRFSSYCSSEWSCRVGRYVIINQRRWLHTTRSWRSAGAGRRSYRHMVVNHEVGHWLGHGHVGCSGPGARAPVMMQQSISLDGCRPNPWPLGRELWFNR